MATMFNFKLDDIPECYHEAVAQNIRYQDAQFFQDLTKNDVADYRQWARENYQPEMEIVSIWHPVVIEECLEIIREFNNGG